MGGSPGDRGIMGGPFRLRRGSRFTWRKECQSIMERWANVSCPLRGSSSALCLVVPPQRECGDWGERSQNFLAILGDIKSVTRCSKQQSRVNSNHNAWYEVMLYLLLGLWGFPTKKPKRERWRSDKTPPQAVRQNELEKKQREVFEIVHKLPQDTRLCDGIIGGMNAGRGGLCLSFAELAPETISGLRKTPSRPNYSAEDVVVGNIFGRLRGSAS